MEIIEVLRQEESKLQRQVRRVLSLVLRTAASEARIKLDVEENGAV